MAVRPASGRRLPTTSPAAAFRATIPTMRARGLQPALVGSPWVRGDVQALATFVLTGGFDSGSRKESANENVMPPFRQLDDATLAAILTYVRQAFGEHAGPVSAEAVALARSH